MADDVKSKIEEVLRHKIALMKINIKRDANFSFLKPLQVKSINGAQKNDALIILPTGYGKSLIFEILPVLENTKVLIVSPLNAIIEEQTRKLGEQAIHVKSSFSEGHKNYNSFKDGKFMYTFGHPEHVLTKNVCTIFKQKNWRNVSHIIVDEAHCVVQWGDDFRPEFRNISKLRAIFPNAKILALTATATQKMQKAIMTNLCLKDTFILSSNVDRPNIKVTVKKRLPITGGMKTAELSFEDCLKPVIEELCKNRETFPKTVVFSKLKWCGIGYDYVNMEAVRHEETIAILETVSQYHAPCTEEMKKKIAKDMAEDGKIKLLFATEAYGMGTDAPDISRIIHIGPPNSLESYMQQIGRAGRDGRNSCAILFYNMSDIGENQKVQPEVREFCLLKSCRKQFLCEHFGFIQQESCVVGHDCCDNCEKDCDCDSCLLKAIEDQETSASASSISKKNDQNDQCDEVKEVLNAYFSAENSEIDDENPELITGLTHVVCDRIATSYQKVTCAEDIIALCPYLKEDYVQNIVTILNSFTC